MPGSATTPDRPGTRDHVRRPSRLPSREQRRHPGLYSFAAQWLAYALPCRRFAHALASMHARLGADVVRYSFIAVDFHHLLLAGLPAHSLEYWVTRSSRAMTVVGGAMTAWYVAPSHPV
jgi:hypothetical protein